MENNTELKRLVNEVIEYLLKDEEKHYEEDPTSNHIYLTLLRLKELNNK